MNPSKKQGQTPQVPNRYLCIGGLFHVEHGAYIVALLELFWIAGQFSSWWTKYHFRRSIAYQTLEWDSLVLTAHMVALPLLVASIFRKFKWFVTPELIVQVSGVLAISINCAMKVVDLLKADYVVTYEYDEQELPNDPVTISWLVFLTSLTIGLKIWYCLILKAYFQYLGDVEEGDKKMDLEPAVSAQ